MEIRRLLGEGFALREVARRYEVHHSTIAAIRDGKNWVQGQVEPTGDQGVGQGPDVPADGPTSEVAEPSFDVLAKAA